MTEKQTTVLIVDDHQMFREGIRNRFEQEEDIQVVGEASSGFEAIQILRQVNASIVILDIRLPDTSGIELAKSIKKEWPDIKILVLTGYDFDQYVRSLLRVGINGYLLKDSPVDTLVEAVREINTGGAVLPPRIASKVVSSYAASPPPTGNEPVWDLTVREIDILELLYQNMHNAEISEKLGISVRTVENHVASIIAKLRAINRADAVRIALEKGLIK